MAFIDLDADHLISMVGHHGLKLPTLRLQQYLQDLQHQNLLMQSAHQSNYSYSNQYLTVVSQSSITNYLLMQDLTPPISLKLLHMMVKALLML